MGISVFSLDKYLSWMTRVLRQIKSVRGIHRFALRGLQKVKTEWQLICLTHNLLKLFRYGWAAQAA